jgi:hypothetical protein
MKMDATIKTLLAKAWKNEDADVTPGRHQIDEEFIVRLTGSVEKLHDEMVAPTVSIPLIPTLALFWEKAGIVRDRALTMLREALAEAMSAKVKEDAAIKARIKDIDEAVNQYATPQERAFLLLGLNCGFGVAEIGTLIHGEVVFTQRHPSESLLDFQSSDADSFIKRIRHKNGVYGEFLLWPQTVQAIQWVMDIRNRQAVSRNGDDENVISSDAESFLFLTENGQSYLTRSEKGNRNQRIPNIFDALVRRVRKDHKDFPKLSFGKLRKTGANFVKRFSDGEVTATFLCHGQAVKIDDLADVYTNRPIGKVFKALRNAELWLEPMFAAAPDNPFPEERKKGGLNISLGLVRKMQKLRGHGYKVDWIAAKCGVNRTTVLRHTSKPQKNGRE